MIIAKGKVNGKENVEGNCQGKCSYAFNYFSSPTILTVSETGITVIFTNAQTVPSVTFNGQSYNVNDILIVAPSYHQYDTARGFSFYDGEMIITHTMTTGNSKMIVTIPLATNAANGKTTSTTILNEITTSLFESEVSAKVVGSEFSLNSIIPQGEFFMYSRESDDVPIICYGRPSAIYISDETLITLKDLMQERVGNGGVKTKSSSSSSSPASYPKIVNPFPPAGANGPLLYMNPTGSSSGMVAQNSEIYIDCRPTLTENTGEQLVGQVTSTNKRDNSKANKVFLYVCIALFITFIICGIAYIYQTQVNRALIKISQKN